MGVKAVLVASMGTDIEFCILIVYTPASVFALINRTVKSKVALLEVAKSGTPVIESV